MRACFLGCTLQMSFSLEESEFPALTSPLWSGALWDSPTPLWVLSLCGLSTCVTVQRPVTGLLPARSRAAVSMSFPRCALLWARLPAGRGAGSRAATCSALRALVGPFPGAPGRVPCLAASSSSASGGSKAPNTSLFVPLTVKPQGPSADGDVGAELTRPLDKSEFWSRRVKRQC